jgi:acyl-CoA reductase-like NAD-dependent aldehyde dehydrogenase
MEAATAISTSTRTAPLESFNPATGELVGSVPTTAPEDVQGVVDAVAQVQPGWAALALPERGRYLERAAQAVIDESDGIRDLLVREQGKPCTEAFSMEVLPTIDALQWIASAGAEILGEEKIPMTQWFLKTKSSAFVYEPLGVIGVISPWNYPWSIPLGEIALALMAGNGVVLKPARVGGVPAAGPVVAPVRRDGRQGLQADREDSVRPEVRPGSRAARWAGSADAARHAAGAGRGAAVALSVRLRAPPPAGWEETPNMS